MDSYSLIPLREKFREKFGDRALFDEPLSPHVAYRVGGPADILVFPQDGAELDWVSAIAREHGQPISVIGTGTNLLVRDEGIRGIVISLARGFQSIEEVPAPEGKVWVRCGGGVEKPQLLEWAMERGLAGLEFSAGVPGTLGGGIYMNAGTKYGCYADILKRLWMFDFEKGVLDLERDELFFGYRKTAVGDKLVLSMIFELVPGDSVAIRREVERIIAERAEKQPLDYPSCGSTFKNPEGFSAGRLIEKSGLKGTTVGGAEISLKHANFILNKGNARAKDILTLIQIARDRVKTEFGVELECEVIVLGGPIA